MLMAGGMYPLAILWTVPVEQRVTASAIISFIVNMFGTVPAPVIVGYLNDDLSTTKDKMNKKVLYLVYTWMIWPTILAAVVGYVAKKKIGLNVDKFG